MRRRQRAPATAKAAARAEVVQFQGDLAQVLGELQRQYGQPLPAVTEWISTGSPALDKAISGLPTGGGLPVGRIVELYGLESAGKSALLEQAYASVRQRLGGLAIDIDIEGTRSEHRLRGLGLAPEDVVYCVPPADGAGKPQPWSMERLLDILRVILSRTIGVPFPTLIGWDSVAATPAQCELDGKLGDPRYGPASRVLSEGMRQLPYLLHRARAALVAVNQLKARQDSGGYEVEQTYAGRPLKFHASVRVKVQVIGQLRPEPHLQTGILILATVAKNKLAPPSRKVVLPYFFDRGFDGPASVLQTLIDQRLVRTSGSWTVVQTRNHRRALYPQPERGYPQWHAHLAACPALLDEATDLLWNPTARVIVEDDSWAGDDR